VNGSVVLTFSKTIDITTFDNALSIDPVVEIGNIQWEADHKTVTLSFAQNLPFDTDFVLTLSPSLTDVNGRAG